MKKSFAIAIAVGTAAVVALSGCATSKGKSGNGGGSGGAHSGKIKIAYVPKALNNPYFAAAYVGAQQAAKKLGAQIVQVGPASPDASAQVPYINTLVQQKVSGIVLSADDPAALVPSVTRAQSAGIPVTTFDSDVTSGRSIFVNQATNDSIARTEVQVMAKQIGYKGQIAILSGTNTAANQNLWVKIMKQELAKPAYKNMQLVKVAYGNTDVQTSTTQTQGLLQQYPNLAGIICPDSVALPTAALVVERAHKAGKVALTGLSLPSQMKKYVHDGTVTTFGLWDVQKLGYLAFYVDYELATGKIKGKPGDTFTAGSLGKYTVGSDQTVVLGPLQLFTKANVDKFHF